MKKSGPPLALIIGGVAVFGLLVLGGAAVGVYFLFFDKDETANTTDSKGGGTSGAKAVVPKAAVPAGWKEFKAKDGSLKGYLPVDTGINLVTEADFLERPQLVHLFGVLDIKDERGRPGPERPPGRDLGRGRARPPLASDDRVLQRRERPGESGLDAREEQGREVGRGGAHITSGKGRADPAYRPGLPAHPSSYPAAGRPGTLRGHLHPSDFPLTRARTCRLSSFARCATERRPPRPKPPAEKHAVRVGQLS
ncbi:MAG: hypothetical protein JWO38_4336 [Gemmataceae bacterium]|nr:hypothetical protein [Gemmataceae bacterium]